MITVKTRLTEENHKAHMPDIAMDRHPEFVTNKVRNQRSTG